MDTNEFDRRLRLVEDVVHVLLQLMTPQQKERLQGRGNPEVREQFHKIQAEHAHGADARCVLSQLASVSFNGEAQSAQSLQGASKAIARASQQEIDELFAAIDITYRHEKQKFYTSAPANERYYKAIRYENAYGHEALFAPYSTYSYMLARFSREYAGGECGSFVGPRQPGIVIDGVPLSGEDIATAVREGLRLRKTRERRRRAYRASFAWMTFARRLLDPVIEEEALRCEVRLQIIEEERERIREEERERIREEERERIRMDEREFLTVSS